MHPIFKKLALILPILAIAACSALDNGREDKDSYPLDHQDARKVKDGKIEGDGGINIFGGGSKDDDGKGGGNGIGVNSFLWRASLDTISFMPIAQADPFGGTILTDWYEDPAAKGERFKLNITILDNRLRADGIHVSMFKQKLDDKLGWRDVAVSKDVTRDIENAILTRARELRVKQTGK